MEAAAKARFQEDLDATRAELAAARSELSKTQAEREAALGAAAAAAAAEKERMIGSHAAELERCAESAGTEVLRLTDALGRARADAERARTALSEALLKVRATVIDFLSQQSRNSKSGCTKYQKKTR